MSSPKLRPLSDFLPAAAAAIAHPLAAPGEPAARHEWTLGLLKKLEWRRFEELCAAYFEALGFAPRAARRAEDGAAEIHLCAAGPAGASILLQCKAWNARRVGIKPVRELRRAMNDAQLDKGVLAAPGDFTQEAASYAGRERIELVDGAALLERLDALASGQSQGLFELATHGDFQTPTCPGCSIRMVARKSAREGRDFWGCRNYPRCRQTFSVAR